MQRFEPYQDRNDEWRWRLWAADGRLIASSGESFSSRSAALRAAEAVRGAAPDAPIAITPGLGDKAALRLRALLATAGDGRRASAETRGSCAGSSVRGGARGQSRSAVRERGWPARSLRVAASAGPEADTPR